MGGNAARPRDLHRREPRRRRAQLYADTLEQLAYGAENAVWRNFFLAGATELRDGNFGTPTQTASPSMMAQLTPEQMFDTLRHQRQRAAGMGSRPRGRHHVPRRRDQLPADAAQRRAGVPQGARRRGDRQRHRHAGEQAAAVGFRRRRHGLTGLGDHRRRRRAAVASSGCWTGPTRASTSSRRSGNRSRPRPSWTGMILNVLRLTLTDDTTPEAVRRRAGGVAPNGLAAVGVVLVSRT